MRHFFRLSFASLFLLVTTSTLFSQAETDIFLVDVKDNPSGYVFENFRNISNNVGYDNQPSFKDNNTLVYARNNEGQNDISVFSIAENSEVFFNSKTEGGEYSPQVLPNSNDLAAVRLDPDGKQRLYQYTKNREPKELIPDLVVAYFVPYNEDTIVGSIIEDNDLHLVVYSFKEEKFYKLLKGSGRSVHNIPETKATSYTSKNEEGNWDIYQLEMDSLESYFICQLPIGIQDYAWLGDYKIFIGSGSQLFLYDLYGNGEWNKIADFSEYNITNITRLAFSPDGTKLAFVAESK